MGFYIESADRPYQSYEAGEEITVGTLVVAESDGTVSLADASTHSGFSGVAAAPRRAEYIAEDEDERAINFTYKTDTTGDRYSGLSENGPHLVPYGGSEDDALIKVRTIEETTDGVTTAPSIADQSIVGFVDTSVGDAPDSAGRLVEEGYTNDENDDTTDTTFNQSNDNFVAIGRAYKPKDGEGGKFDGIVRVEVDNSL